MLDNWHIAYLYPAFDEHFELFFFDTHISLYIPSQSFRCKGIRSFAIWKKNPSWVVSEKLNICLNSYQILSPVDQFPPFCLARKNFGQNVYWDMLCNPETVWWLSNLWTLQASFTCDLCLFKGSCLYFNMLLIPHPPRAWETKIIRVAETFSNIKKNVLN